MSNSAQFWSNDNFVQRKVKFYKVSGKIILRILFKDVILIIKFEPMGEFNFENRYVLIDYNIVIILTNVD